MTRSHQRTDDPLRLVVRKLPRRIHAHPRPISVYVYRDADGRPLYVGQSEDLPSRHMAHRMNADWFPDAASFKVLAVLSNRDEARAAEARAIRRLKPLHNIHHNPRKDAA